MTLEDVSWDAVYVGENPKIPLTGHVWLVVDKETREIKGMSITRKYARMYQTETETIIKANYMEAK